MSLIDFGMASRFKVLGGTPDYFAPEARKVFLEVTNSDDESLLYPASEKTESYSAGETLLKILPSHSALRRVAEQMKAINPAERLPLSFISALLLAELHKGFDDALSRELRAYNCFTQDRAEVKAFLALCEGSTAKNNLLTFENIHRIQLNSDLKAVLISNYDYLNSSGFDPSSTNGVKVREFIQDLMQRESQRLDDTPAQASSALFFGQQRDASNQMVYQKMDASPK
ncbi:hypothetical protein A0O36_01212 [Piscirickettsiaceae bacterium NZ-RLO1]|nr:hypothetical protein A0O36_01212 [Piscirickettsiaceae bacterium NZ-RLO1]